MPAGMANLRFGELKAPLNLEALPSLTVANSRERLSPDAWGKRVSAQGLGIGLKYGLTSSITGGDGNMLTSFYSRRVVDPGWGTRLTGTAGQNCLFFKVSYLWRF